MKLKISKKSVALVTAMALAFGCGIGGTLAWLTATTGEVVNTFTVGNVDLTLDESKFENGKLNSTDRVVANTYHILPGTTQPKDPVVTVEANSEDCYIFVQVQEVNNKVGNTTNKYITYTMNSCWNATPIAISADGTTTTYVLDGSYTTKNTDDPHYIFAGDEKGIVSYPRTLTKENMDLLYEKDATTGEKVLKIVPKLVFKAFAVQKEAASTAAEAWTKVTETERLDYVPSTT